MNNLWTGKILGAGIGFLSSGGRLVGLIIGGLLGHFFVDEKGGSAWGAILGFMFAGPLGAIAGAYLGNSYAKTKQEGFRTMDPRAMFQINLISILSYVAKVDGEVSPVEVQTILGVFQRMGYNAYQMQAIERTLSVALQQDISLESVCQNFRKASRYEERLMLLRIVYMVVMADQKVHPREQDAIQKIVDYLGILGDDYISLQGEFVKSADKYYKILGLQRGASKVEVKRAYRKLALKHHPDRVRQLGPEYVSQAEDDFQRINEAYNKVMDELK